MKKDLTELVFIVDRSGSMSGLESDTIGGFNATLKAHQEADGQAVVSTVLFDHETKVLHDRIPIENVSPLTEKDYKVRGCTALLDAVGGAIYHISNIHKYLPEEYKPEHTIFVITTDGLENASIKYTYKQVKHLITEKEEAGWDFLFLGANIDAAAEASKIGIPVARAATFIADELGSKTMFGAVCAETINMRTGCSQRDDSWKGSIEQDTATRK
ncbi:MAG: hypothetical protein U0K14_06100 [Eggerthellaceae bacterium]|nr:hypothetical protein [Eggerthellaceae bacterium]